MRRSSKLSLLLCSVACQATGGTVLAQQVETNSSPVPATSRTATANTGVTPPMGPPDDPFGDRAAYGEVIGGFRFNPSISLTTLRDTNPLMSSPKGPADSGTAADLALRITPIRPNGASAFFAVGATRLSNLDRERDLRLIGQVQGALPAAGWILPLSLIYSRNNLERGSLLSQERVDSPPLTERQVAVTTIGSVDAIRTFGLNTLTFGLRLTDTEIGDARTTGGAVQKSTASNLAETWSAKLARPLTPASQWYLRGSYDRYRYDSGNQPVIGTRDSESPALALGIQGMHGKFQGMAELGYQTKQAHSTVVPDSHSAIGAVILGYAVSPALRLNARVNRLVIETNVPGVSNFVAVATGAGLDWRFAPEWIVQFDTSLTNLDPHPVPGLLKDHASNLTLLWKPSSRVLFALTQAHTRRSVSQELVGFASPYTNSKTTLNLTYYF